MKIKLPPKVILIEFGLELKGNMNPVLIRSLIKRKLLQKKLFIEFNLELTVTIN